jgi:signal transduction histidine kinase
MKKKSLRNKILLLLGLVLFCPVIIITSVIISIGYNSLYKSILQQQIEIANRVSNRVFIAVDSSMKLLENIIEISKQQTKNELTILFKNVMRTNKNILELILVDNNGNELIKIDSIDNKQIISNKLINRKKREEFINAIRYGSFISHQIGFTPDRIPYLIISVAKEKTVIIAKISLIEMWNIISETKIGFQGYVFIVDTTGRLIAHPEPARVLAHTDFSNLAIVNDFINKKKIRNWRIYNDESGVKVVSVYASIPKLKWAVVTQIPTNEVFSPINKMIFQTVILSLCFVVIFSILGFRLVNNLLNPLNKLRQAVNYISKGKFDIKIDIKSGDEIEELAMTFNSMVESLKQLEELRQDLISMIIHDMKSPLSGITGGIDYLVKCNQGSDEYNQIITIIKNSANNLLTLIQNLVDISRMEEGKLQPKLEQIQCEKLFKETIEQFSLLTKSEDKELIVEFDQDLPILNVDKELIIRVINNLLTNALHHTTSGGKIWFKINKIADDKIKVSVSDNGVGIPEEYKDKIFEKFVQVERKRARLRTGTGLGLTFCKMAVELHNGKIWVESEPGKGSSFMFTLPV